MQRERTQFDDPEREHESPPAPPVQQPDRLAWASAVGNQAVQALARQVAPPEEEEAVPEEEAAPEEESAEAAAMPEELPEDELPE
jgi:hypothetical protein